MRGLYHEPVGVDFAAATARGLRARLAGQPPEALARVTLLVNTNRMAARIRAALAADGPTLLPRIGLVSDLVPLLPPGSLPAPDVTPLSLRLRLTRLVRARLEAEPGLSPPDAAFDLAGTLMTLMDEMREEGVAPEALHDVEMHSDLSEHWRRSLDFLRIVTHWAEADGSITSGDVQARALSALLDDWAGTPPADPVIVAGSTASRAPTARLMRAVLDLPQGAVILPGLDPDMPEPAWRGLTRADEPACGPQDHPQWRHAAFLDACGATRDDCPRWSDLPVACEPRNRLISLALRPAPVTDAWREEGPLLTDVAGACAGITRVDAPSPGAEARAVALGLRAALEDGRRAALITPDRTLARQVAAQLDRWGIEPDDSAGRPLSQSAPGRLLLHLAAMMGRPVEGEALAILLAHPLVCLGGDRPTHLRRARALEAELIRPTPCPFPDRAAVAAWGGDDAWTHALCDLLDALAAAPREATLARRLDALRGLAERAAGDPDAPWSGEAGRLALRVVETLDAAASEAAEPMQAPAFLRILRACLAAEEVRESYAPHPDVMIWGALEARVRSADLVILGGLNDGVWPEHQGAEPWLNRSLRLACGLRAPERVTGLSAHDFQLAAAGQEVWLTRAARDAETEQVPSRWLNRLESLLTGIGGEAEAARRAMHERGARWLGLAARIDAPDGPAERARRPAPVVPPDAVPSQLSVTAIETLIRDPYAIYARSILRLRPMNPLRQGPDARLRGTVVHDAMERFLRDNPDDLPDDAAARLRATLAGTVEAQSPWPAIRRVWLGKFDRVADDLLTAEAGRRARGRPVRMEAKGALTLPEIGFTLTAKADRLDQHHDGGVAIYDYKTGTPPSERETRAFAKQLLLEAVMVAEGAFEGIDTRLVRELAYLEIGSRYGERAIPFDDEVLAETRAGLVALVRAYRDGRGFVARLAPKHIKYASDYDQLARFGEWDDTHPAVPVRVGA